MNWKEFKCETCGKGFYLRDVREEDVHAVNCSACREKKGNVTAVRWKEHER